jgi:hypothetical protein
MKKRLSIAVETAHFRTAEVVVEAADIAHTPAEVVVVAADIAHTPAEVAVVAAAGTAHKLAAVVAADRNRSLQEQVGHRIHTDCSSEALVPPIGFPAERQIQQAHLDQREMEIS